MNTQQKKFIETVWKFYEDHGRHGLLWRKTKNPYRILISEVMLQQTQVDRVIPKYQAFLEEFPTVETLSQASLGEVLRLWQGLGYNRRAKMLHVCAQIIVHEYDGSFPKSYTSLMKLPGVGPYTAGAIMAFAYNISVPILETNIRSVFLHHFFKDQKDISDREIIRYVVLTLDQDNPREWYYALMDYGAHIKKKFGNPNHKSKHHVVQSAFKGSDRQIRGAIVRLLSDHSSLSKKEMCTELSVYEKGRIDAQIERLLSEGLIVLRRRRFLLP
jgi:A/G-specific adenine glycosylase